VDEFGCNIDMVRRYGRAPKGERIVEKVPRNTPANLSVACAVAPEGVIAAMDVPGAIDGQAFELFLERCLVPKLRPGDIVLMDNLSTHEMARVPELIESAGALMMYLPPHSPDFNPIEQCISKIKEFLRSVAARTRSKLRRALTKAINSVTPTDVKGWFEYAGYWVTPVREPL
jgi:transposase